MSTRSENEMEDSGMTDDKPKDNEPPPAKSISLIPEEIEALREDDLKAHLRMQELINQAKARGEL